MNYLSGLVRTFLAIPLGVLRILAMIVVGAGGVVLGLWLGSWALLQVSVYKGHTLYIEGPGLIAFFAALVVVCIFYYYTMWFVSENTHWLDWVF